MFPADDRTGDRRKGDVQVSAAYVADGEASEADQPTPSALHDPAVEAEVLAARDASVRNPRCNVAGVELTLAATISVDLTGMHLAGLHRRQPLWQVHVRHRVGDGCQHTTVVAVSLSQPSGERGALGVQDDVALRPRLAQVRRFRARRGTPFPRQQAGAVESSARLIERINVLQLVKHHSV